MGLDPYLLADAVDMLWRDAHGGAAEHSEAVRDARKATGLTLNRIEKWEEAGKDHSTYPGFDTKARTLASEMPSLGIGQGYKGGTNADAADYAGELWQLLRESNKRPAKDDPALLRQAVELAAANNVEIIRPLSFSAERFAAWLLKSNIPWPRLLSGALDLSDDAFRQMARLHPSVAPLRELRHSLSQLRLNDLCRRDRWPQSVPVVGIRQSHGTQSAE